MIIPAVGFFLLPVSALFLLFTNRRMRQTMGDLETSFSLKWNILDFLIVFSTPVLIAVNYIRELGAFTVFSVTGVGVLGFTLGIKNLMYKRQSGIYQNGLIWLADSVLYTSIGEYTHSEPNAVSIVTQDRSQKTIILTDQKLILLISEKLASRMQPLQ